MQITQANPHYLPTLRTDIALGELRIRYQLSFFPFIFASFISSLPCNSHYSRLYAVPRASLTLHHFYNFQFDEFVQVAVSFCVFFKITIRIRENLVSISQDSFG